MAHVHAKFRRDQAVNTTYIHMTIIRSVFLLNVVTYFYFVIFILQAWIDCTALESSLSCFKHLRQYLVNQSSEWEEYFQVGIPYIFLNVLAFYTQVSPSSFLIMISATWRNGHDIPIGPLLEAIFDGDSCVKIVI